MVAELDDLTGLDDRDLIGIPNGGKAMGDDEYSLAVHQAVQALLDLLLGPGINGGGCLVHDEHRRLCHRSPAMFRS